MSGIAVMKTSMKAAISTRTHLAGFCLWTAGYLADQCSQFEIEPIPRTGQGIPDQGSDFNRRLHPGLASAAIMQSVAFLEASIEALCADLDQSKNGRIPRLSLLSPTEIAAWSSPKKSPRGSSETIWKYNYVLTRWVQRSLSSTYVELEKEANALIRLRNKLVHFQPESSHDLRVHKDLENLLKARFKSNPYWVSNMGAWFPIGCLGASCAQWAEKTAREYYDEFCKLLPMECQTEHETDPWRYAHINPGQKGDIRQVGNKIEWT